MENIKLKPCPFCGGEVENLAGGWGVAAVISCKTCKTLFVLPWNETETANDLREAWERRVDGQNADEMLEVDA